MLLQSIRGCRACLLAVILLSPPETWAAERVPEHSTGSIVLAQASWGAMIEYRRQLAVYMTARQSYEAEADAYWSAVAEKRRQRVAKRRGKDAIVLQDYVLTQPPVYTGPPPPVDPSAPPEEPQPRKYVPVVADFLQAAAREFKFVPQHPQNEIEYKRAYARVAAAAGLTKEQVVRIYAFESGGNGKYDVQAGLEYPKPDARAISTALGYNQLMSANSVELLAEKGDHFVKVLQAKAAALGGEGRDALTRKIAVLKAMIAFSRTVPDSWSAHERLADTAKGLAIHSLNLDIDIGPLLQTQKLLDSVRFARSQGYDVALSAAELEMMNLTGDGNGIDMITMPAAWRERVPTSNFFRPVGYARNPVAVRNNVVAKLIAVTNVRMDEECRLQGAKDMAAVFPKQSMSAER